MIWFNLNMNTEYCSTDSSLTVKKTVYSINFLLNPKISNTQTVSYLMMIVEKLFWFLFNRETCLPSLIVNEVDQSVREGSICFVFEGGGHVASICGRSIMI